MTGPARAPFLLGAPSVISIVRKSRGSAALVMGKVQLPPSGTWNVPAAATWPSLLTYQQVYHWRSPGLLRWATVKLMVQLPEASWRAVARPVAAPKPSSRAVVVA